MARCRSCSSCSAPWHAASRSGAPLRAERWFGILSLVPIEPQLEMPPHIRPLSSEDAVHHDVAGAAVAPDAEMANHAVLLGAERLNGALRSKIEVVRAETDDLAAQRLEGVAQQQELAGRVHVRALAALPIPRVPDFHAIDRRGDVVIARRPDDRPARHVTHDPGQHVPVALAVQRVGDVRLHPLGWRDRDVPELPQAAVTCRRGQRVTVRFGQWLEPNAVTFEYYRLGGDHAGESTLPYLTGRRSPARRRSAIVRRA